MKQNCNSKFLTITVVGLSAYITYVTQKLLAGIILSSLQAPDFMCTKIHML